MASDAMRGFSPKSSTASLPCASRTVAPLSTIPLAIALAAAAPSELSGTSSAKRSVVVPEPET